MAAAVGMDGRTARQGFGGSLAGEWLCLTLTQNTAGAAAATRLSSLLAALRRTAAKSRPLAEHFPARVRHVRSGSGKAGAAGWWGCRSSLESPRGEGRGKEAGHVVPPPGAAQLVSTAAEPARAARISRQRAAPSPGSRHSSVMRSPSTEQGRAGVLPSRVRYRSPWRPTVVLTAPWEV